MKRLNIVLLALIALFLIIPDVGANGGLFSRSRSRSVEKVRVQNIRIKEVVQVQKVVQQVQVQKVVQQVQVQKVVAAQIYPVQAYYQAQSSYCPPALMAPQQQSQSSLLQEQLLREQVELLRQQNAQLRLQMQKVP